jgi:hypothetical protein
MKKLFLSLAMITFIAGTLSTSIGQIPDKVAIQNPGTLTETRKNILVVNKVSPVVQQDTITDYQKFTAASELKFTANKESVNDLKLKIAVCDTTKFVENSMKLDSLEQKNIGMKNDLALYKVEGQVEWTAYKEQFNSDLDKLTLELKDFKIE